MFQITILAIGKIKESYFREAIGEYVKRLKPYAKIEVVELGAESFGKGAKDKAKKSEADKIVSFIEKRKDSEVLVLDEAGRNFSSAEFAANISQKTGKIIFVVGGALGFGEEISKGKWQKISLSRMTFPHEMARVVLVEQIYRAITILKNKEYHY